MPKLIVLPFILCTIIYWMSKVLDDFSIYVQIVLILVLNSQIAVAYGTLISVIAPNVDVALGLAIPCLMPILIFAGFFLNNESTPAYFVWIKYISWMFYANESINSVLWSNFGEIPCSIEKSPNSTCTPKNCFKNGDMVLNFLGFADVSKICILNLKNNLCKILFEGYRCDECFDNDRDVHRVKSSFICYSSSEIKEILEINFTK